MLSRLREVNTMHEFNPPVHMLLEVLQTWWAPLCKSHFFLAAITSAIVQKVTHELFPVIHVKVAVALQGTAKLAARFRDGLHSLHEEVTHLGQLCHWFYVSLREHEGGIVEACNRPLKQQRGCSLYPLTCATSAFWRVPQYRQPSRDAPTSAKMGQSSLHCISWLLPFCSPDISTLQRANPANFVAIWKYL